MRRAAAAALGRGLEVAVAGALLLAALPVLVAAALWVWLDDGGPVIHRQVRVGRGGRPFVIHKLRTLRAGAGGPEVAATGDARITRPGRWLRRWRIDELPQLADVLAGTMSLVGPRPQTAANLAAVDPGIRRRLLAVRPGITGPAALAHLAEDDVLAGVDDPVETYRRILVPAKVRIELDHLDRRTLLRDVALLARTVLAVLSPSARRRSLARVRALVAAAGVDGPAVMP